MGQRTQTWMKGMRFMPVLIFELHYLPWFDRSDQSTLSNIAKLQADNYATWGKKWNELQRRGDKLTGIGRQHCWLEARSSCSIAYTPVPADIWLWCWVSSSRFLAYERSLASPAEDSKAFSAVSHFGQDLFSPRSGGLSSRALLRFSLPPLIQGSCDHW